MGYDMTTRQVYYRLVAGGHVENTFANYKAIASLINDARLAGMLDWNYIVDRTRNLQSLAHWNSPADIIASAYDSYSRDKWVDQAYHVEIWVEKEALIGVIERIANEFDCPYFACRGYVSQSEMRDAALRFLRYRSEGKQGRIIHLGDHDPSGIHMTQDIQQRFQMFGASTVVQRVALTMAQVEELNPPPNPAKETDARFADYVLEYGEESWELDAIDPIAMHTIIRDAIEPYVDRTKWNATVEREQEERAILKVCSDQWETTENFITHTYTAAYESALDELRNIVAEEGQGEEE